MAKIKSSHQTLLILAIGLALVGCQGRSLPASGASPAEQRILEALTADAPGFVPYIGSSNSPVRFRLNAPSGSVLLGSTDLWFALPGLSPDRRFAHDDPGPFFRTLRMSYVDPSSETRLKGEQPRENTVNYYYGSDSANWKQGLPTYGALQYQELYPGIHLTLESAGAAAGRELLLKTTYRVEPGADPALIRWRYPDAREVTLSEIGDLVIEAAASPTEEPARLVDRAPVAWQLIDGRRWAVSVRYQLHPDLSIGFALGEFDPTRALFIDPILEYSSLLGGTSLDEAYAVAVDSARNIYLVGSTFSVDFPSDFPVAETLAGSRNVLIVKLSPDGSRVENSTILGGDRDDIAYDVTVDSLGDLYLTGSTASANFPLTLPAELPGEEDANVFVIKLSIGGALRYSILFGGSGDDVGYGVAVDRVGSAYIVGQTESEDFPTLSPLLPWPGGGDSDGFVVKLAPKGSEMLYSSYLGGNGQDAAYAVALDRDGSAHVTGVTASDDFPVVEPLLDALVGAEDAFLVKFAPKMDGYLYGTYLGIAEGGIGHDIEIDRDGQVYVAGTITHPDPLEAPGGLPAFGGTDAFALKLSPAGDAILYKSSLGGAEDDEAFGIAVDRDGVTYVTGSTESSNLPIDGSLQGSYAGGGDVFVVQLGQSGNVVTYNYLGGSGLDVGNGIAVLGSGDAVLAGTSFSPDFPRVGPVQADFRGAGDLFAARLGEVEFIPTPAPTATPQPTPIPPTATPMPPAYVGLVQTDMFLYSVFGLMGFTALMFVAEMVRVRIRRRRGKS